MEIVVMVKMSALCCSFILGHSPNYTKILDLFGITMFRGSSVLRSLGILALKRPSIFFKKLCDMFCR